MDLTRQGMDSIDQLDWTGQTRQAADATGQTTRPRPRLDRQTRQAARSDATGRLDLVDRTDVRNLSSTRPGRRRDRQ